MLQQDLHAQKDQKDAAGELRPLFIPGAEKVTHHNAHQRQAEGGTADDGDGRDDRNL